MTISLNDSSNLTSDNLQFFTIQKLKEAHLLCYIIHTNIINHLQCWTKEFKNLLNTYSKSFAPDKDEI